MVSSVLLSQKNSNTQIKSYFQSSPPPLSMTQFRLNGQRWVWGKVSDDGNWKCHWWLVFLAALMWQSGPALAVRRSINQRNSVPRHPFTTFVYCPGRSRIPSFGLINSSFLATSKLTVSLHLLSCSTDASQHRYQKHNMSSYFIGNCRLTSTSTAHSIYLIKPWFVI